MREKLHNHTTYYVRTDGSDSNLGLENTSGGAFLTVQKAINHILNDIDTNRYNVTIQVGNGTYTSGGYISRRIVGGGTLFIFGDTTTPSNVVINVTTAGDRGFSSLNENNNLIIRGFRIQTNNGDAIAAINGGNIYFGEIEFGNCGTGAHLNSFQHAQIACIQNYSIIGSAAFHAIAQFNSTLRVQSRAITLTGTPSFGYFFAYVYHSALVDFFATTFSGTATGTRYGGQMLSVIGTGLQNSSATYFPGNVNGSVGNGSVYI